MHLCISKNLTIFITAPDLFRINPYVVTDRCTCVMKVYMDNQLNRGRFAFYGKKKIKPLYFNGKKNKGSFPVYPRPDFLGRFTDYVPTFNKDYERAKQKAMEELTGGNDSSSLSLSELKPIYIKLLQKVPKMEKPITLNQFADLTGLHRNTISAWKALDVPKSP